MCAKKSNAKKETKEEKVINVKLSEKEKRQVEILAFIENKSLKDFCKDVLLNEVENNKSIVAKIEKTIKEVKK